ncbi:MAG: hypothetical protein ABW221_19150 [Vicinamibacteria bacterium]
MRRATAPLLLAAALACFAYRMVDLDSASFTRDEPQFLTAAREQPRTGHWLQANPLFGNLGRRYGPVAFWFYGAVTALLGDDPRRAILAMGALLTLSQVALAWAVTRALRESAAFCAVLAAWIASSPYLFFWSRMAWDLTSLAGGCAAVALIARPGALGPGRAALAGVALGVGVGTHPMIAPLALAAVFVIAWELRAAPRRLAATLGAMAAAGVAVLLPYLSYLTRARVFARAPFREHRAPGIAALALDAPMIATSWRVDRYFDGSWDAFLAWSGTGLLASTSGALAIAVAAAAVAGLACALRSPAEGERRLARVGVLVWPGVVAMLAVLGLDGHVHYQFAAVWVPFFGVAALVAALRRRDPRWGRAALGLVAAVALAQCAMVVQWTRFVRLHQGTRGATYGSPVGAQIAAVRAVCAAPEARIALRNETAQFRYPFEYLALTDSACAGKTVVVCAETPGPFARPCPPDEPGTRVRRLRYARETGGALRVD